MKIDRATLISTSFDRLWNNLNYTKDGGEHISEELSIGNITLMLFFSN
jgi:hypothetical protein